MTQKLHILVVDDEPSVSASILWALKPSGHATKVVNDGVQALAKVAEEPLIDLVITDHSMPRMSGLELASQLRGRSYQGKVVVLSAHLTEQTRAAYDSLGVDAVMRKPFDVNALRKVVGELFQHLPVTL